MAKNIPQPLQAILADSIELDMQATISAMPHTQFVNTEPGCRAKVCVKAPLLGDPQWLVEKNFRLQLKAMHMREAVGLSYHYNNALITVIEQDPESYRTL